MICHNSFTILFLILLIPVFEIEVSKLNKYIATHEHRVKNRLEVLHNSHVFFVPLVNEQAKTLHCPIVRILITVLFQFGSELPDCVIQVVHGVVTTRELIEFVAPLLREHAGFDL